MKRYVGLLTLLAALTAPAPAGALIQVDRAIAGVRLDNTPAEVRAALGDPNRVVNGTNVFGPWTEYRYAGRIYVFFQGRRNVTGVTTRGLGDRTARGVGVRSRERSVRRKVRGVTCDTITGTRSCHTGSFTAGERVTDFKIRRGRVRSVTVGYVID